MIIYFADRKMNVLGHASTNLPDGYVITEDLKTEEIESGVATFSCRIGFTVENRAELETMADAGNYLLRSHDNENEFYTIIDAEIDTKNQEIYIYAEDAGLDLLNEIAGEFEANEAHTAEWYINKYIIDSGFEIGINEIPSDSERKLAWEGEETVTSRLASIATQFGGYEISYSFDIKGLQITNKYVNIHKERGKDDGINLRLNREIDKIVTTKSVANLATAFVCEGAVSDSGTEPITFSSTGYTYDDGDFFVDGDKLKSRRANEQWSRYVWNKEPNQLEGYEGYIVRPYSYNTDDPDTLRAHAMTELKKCCDMEVNYEIDIHRLPEGVKIGDRVNIIDDAGGLYVSTRLLRLESSVVDDKYSATLGEHLIKTSGISQKVIELAEQFAKSTQSVERALTVANNAKTAAEEAKQDAYIAEQYTNEALRTASLALTDAGAALTNAASAEAKAQAAQAAVGKVEESVSSLETTVENAQAAAENAQAAAQTANAKAEEAATAASNAETAAEEAKRDAYDAVQYTNEALTNANYAVVQAGDAITQATEASQTAQAAKLDAEQAKEDVEALGEDLETVRTTMSTDYARKNELTETTAQLQTQISQNAAQISSTAAQVLVIDETANDAKEKADAAQTAASTAQTKADQATTEAQAAQTAADNAAAAAASAQSEADKAKAAADAAQDVVDKAGADLEAAIADLATVSGRVDATEEEIAAAQEAVTNAQTAANNAKADADAAALKADEAQTKANTAATKADNAQAKADEAASKAALAQAAADEAKGDASAAQARADEAAGIAAEAQQTANTAVSNAATAQAKANQAAADAVTAQNAANAANATLAQAQTDLEAAKANLEAVTSRVGATEEEVAAAQEAVDRAQAAADTAKSEAEAAQSTADTAKANAAAAQTAADNAKTAADNAQKAAEDAAAAAKKAQDDVDALVVVVTDQWTAINQKADAIELEAYKTEVTQTLGGYYTKEEANAAIQVKADEINLSVNQKIDGVEVGARNLLKKTAFVNLSDYSTFMNAATIERTEEGLLLTGSSEHYDGLVFDLANEGCLENGQEYTLSFLYRANKALSASLFALRKKTPNVSLSTLNIQASELEWQKMKVTFSDSTLKSRNLLDISSGWNASAATTLINGDELTITGNCVSKRIYNLPSGQYTLSYESTRTGTKGGGYSIYCRDAGDKNLYTTFHQNDSGTQSVTFTIPAGTSYTIIYLYGTNASTNTTDSSTFTNVQLEPGDTKTDYIAFGNMATQMLFPYFMDGECWIEIQGKSVKLEKGDKATDWSPAPEDVDLEFEYWAGELGKNIADSETRLTQTAEEITAAAVEDCVKTNEFGDFKQSVEGQLTVMPTEIAAKFSDAIEYAQTVNGEVQTIKEQLEKHFEFSMDGLVIHAGEGSMTLTLDNDEIVFKKNDEEFGRWNGTLFVASRIKIGNVEIKATDNGSVKIGKAGG